MCGRFTAAKDFSELIKLFGVVMAQAPFFAPRYNIAPTQFAPVICHERHQPAVKPMRWGLIPSWAKDESVGNANINARSEMLPCRYAFREACKQRRCLIPATVFRVAGTRGERLVTALEIPPVESALTAVRVSIVADGKKNRK